jgi:CopA family copper-resistance protein
MPPVFSTSPVTRRSFVRTGLSMSALAGLDSLLPSYAHAAAGLFPGELRTSTTEVDLAIGSTGVTIDGRAGMAQTVNGSIPGPLLRFREGDTAVIRVRNDLADDTSIHWHGILLPPGMDGVPGVSFDGIPADTTFRYEYLIRQTGTYWYHSHSGFQEQLGVYGPLILDPAGPDPIESDREFVVMLSDWTFEDPHSVMANLKKQSGYYNYQRRTVAGLFGADSGISDRLAWGKMRMDATDLADVTGHTYTYLMNGMGPESNWTGLFKPGERVRLRFINASAASFMDVRIPGLRMTVVQADGQNIVPVTVDEFRMGIAETYDVIVEPTADQAYTVFAESMDRSGYARGTLTPAEGMAAEVPELRARPVRTMAAMGMFGMDMGSGDEGGGMQMDMGPDAAPMTGDSMAGHNMAGMAGMADQGDGVVMHPPDDHGPGNTSIPMATKPQMDEPGIGLGDDGWTVLTYADLRRSDMSMDMRPPMREIELHLTGNMERYMWSFDGKKFSQAKDPIMMKLGERLRIVFINDTMMEHPIHLHGMWMEPENGHGAMSARKHTVNVKPAERLPVLITPNDLGDWAFHCHILYHMDAGMFRVVRVVEDAVAEETS